MNECKETWTKVDYFLGEPPLGIDALRDLVENKYAAILLKNILDEKNQDICTKIIRRNLERAVATCYSNGTLTTLGSYLAKHLTCVDNYFAQAQVNSSLFPQDADLYLYVTEKIKYIFGLCNLETAMEADGRRYAPFIVRIHANGVMNPLHNDNIMRDAASSNLILAKLKYQLSCLVCLQECDDGGRLHHYRKLWIPEDEKYKIENGIGYERGVVKNKDCFVFKPQVGDVYLINPTNYHEIDRVSGKERITLGFFIGFFDDELKNGVIWT